MAISLRLSHKIPLSIIMATLITGGALIWISGYEMNKEAEREISALINDGLVYKKKAFEAYLDTIVGDLHTIADNPFIIQSAEEFTAAYAEIGADALSYLHNLYITQNPNETGKKHLLDAATDGTKYSELHAKYHPYLREFLEEHGYYDIFIVDAQGNVVYTVFKELDYATNLKTGQWKDTDLAKVYHAIMAQKDPEEVSYADFAPYAPSNNVPAGFIGRPIETADGKYIGALIYQMPIEKLNGMLSDETGLGNTGRVTLVGEDFLARNDVRFAKESTILKLKMETPEVKEALDGKVGMNMHGFDAAGVPTLIGYSGMEFKGAKFAFIMEKAKDEVFAGVTEARNELLLLAAAIVAAITVLGIFFARSITGPVTRITRAMEDISANKLQTDVPALGRKDEIGEMAKALQVFKDNAIRMEQMKAEQARLEKIAQEEKRAAMHQLANDFEKKVQGIINMVSSASTELCQTAENMKNAVTGVSQQSSAVASSSGQTSHNVQNVASAIEEMSASVREIAGQVSKSTAIVNEAVDKTQSADATVKSLSDAVTQIGDISNLIQGIADQINLLALNATIESARAGEAGKGFAVVASEVKNLATQTANATGQIIQNIENVRAVSEQVSSALSQIQVAIKDVNQYSSGIAAAVEEQSAATNEITANMQQASKGVQDINENIAHVSKNVEVADAGAIEVLDAAKMLSQQSEQLNKQVKEFLADIRDDGKAA